MNILRHLTYTWLFSLLLQPIIFLLYFRKAYEEGYGLDYAHVLAFNFAYSWPAYLLGLLFFGWLRFFPGSPAAKLLAWIGFSSVAIFLSALICCLFFLDARFFSDFLLFCIPGILSGALSIMLRYPQFVRAVQTGSQKAGGDN